MTQLRPAESRTPQFNGDVTILLAETANRSLRRLEALDVSHVRLAARQDHLDIQHPKAFGRDGYVLSVVAATSLPLGFVTDLFGINVGGTPLIASNFGAGS